MVTYKIERQIEGDIDSINNYYTNNLEFPFPEDSIIKARELEANRFKTIQFSCFESYWL